MNITIQLSDEAYASLLKSNKRIQGSLGLVNPTEGNFNVHNRQRYPSHDTRYKCLPHGRVSINRESVCLRLHIHRDEGISPHIAIGKESIIAGAFIIEEEDKE